MVANMGLRLVAAPRQKGHIYLAETEDPHGQRRRLVFDAYNGTVVQNVPLGHGPKPVKQIQAFGDGKSGNVERLALLESVDNGNLSLNKLVSRWMSV